MTFHVREIRISPTPVIPTACRAADRLASSVFVVEFIHDLVHHCRDAVEQVQRCDGVRIGGALRALWSLGARGSLGALGTRIALWALGACVTLRARFSLRARGAGFALITLIAYGAPKQVWVLLNN